MPIKYEFVMDCEEDGCDGKARSGIALDLTQDNPDVIEIDVYSLSQTELMCDECGKSYYTGDIEVLSEDEI